MPNETGRDVVVRIALKQMQTRLEAPDVTPIQKAYDKVDKQIEKVNKSVDDLTKTHLEMVDQNIKVADSLRTAGEGAFTLARGLAFVGASTEDDFEKALQTIAKVQGAYDIFKGVIDVTKGIAEARRALMIVTNAATTAEAVHTAAMRASTVAAATATAAAAGLHAALLPITLVLGGGAGLVFLMKQYSDASREAAEAEELQRQRAQATRMEWEKQISAQKELESIEKRRKDLEDRASRSIFELRARGRLEEIQTRFDRNPSRERFELQRFYRELQGVSVPSPAPTVTTHAEGGGMTQQVGAPSTEELVRYYKDVAAKQEVMLATLQSIVAAEGQNHTHYLNSLLEHKRKLEDTNVRLIQLESAL